MKFKAPFFQGNLQKTRWKKTTKKKPATQNHTKSAFEVPSLKTSRLHPGGFVDKATPVTDRKKTNIKTPEKD